MIRTLNLRQAHQYVADNADKAYWNGYDIVIFSPDSGAFMSKRGVFDRKFKKWGFTKSYSPNSHGKWKIS